MNPDQAVTLVSNLLRTTLYVTGPLLAVAVMAGVFVGIVQTATQVNEASISFVVKVVAVVGVAAAVGSQLATYVLDYTRANLDAIGNVVR
ncbi:MAG TPA: flagellar biosynthetic protein FliQ [Polyangiaceae bacterium]|nr:flagellar biosynthetic protein FliQ [Polyangiaceae bacterium]